MLQQADPVHQTRYFKLENFQTQIKIDWEMLVNALLIKMTLQNWFFSYTANVLSAEITDKCLQTKSKDN